VKCFSIRAELCAVPTMMVQHFTFEKMCARSHRAVVLD